MKSFSISAKDFERLAALQEGTLSKAEFQQLEQDLEERPELRREWIHLQDLDDELNRYFQRPPIKQKSTVKNPASILLLGLAAVLIIGFFVMALYLTNKSPAVRYTSVDLEGVESVAMITRLDGIGEKMKFAVGRTLKPGVIQLEKGQLELTFFCGASLQLEGPAELQILNQDEAYLTQGKAAARVPKEAIGFTVKTPEAAVVDLGTEFAIAVDETGDSQVHVYDGEVRVSLLGKDGSTLSSSPVLAGDSLEIEPREKELRRVDQLSKLPRIVPIQQDALSVPEAYTKAVLQSKPLLYWDFSNTDGKKVPDLSGNGWDGTIHGGVEVVEGGGYFGEASEADAYVSSLPLPKLNEGPYSVEIWVNPRRYHYATLVALHSDWVMEENKSRNHLSVMELMTRSHLVHRPGSIRFLHRWQGSEVNAFSDKPFLPGRWHHIVGVRDEEDVHLYVNGELVRTVKKVEENSVLDYQVILGQLEDLRSIRQFEGILDEFAVYTRALQADEIAVHYQLMNLSSR